MCKSVASTPNTLPGEQPWTPFQNHRTDPEDQELIQRQACPAGTLVCNSAEAAHPCSVLLCRVLSTEGAEQGTCWAPQEHPAHTGCTAQASTAYIPSWRTAFLLTLTTVPVYTDRAWPLSLQKEESEGKWLSWCLVVPPTSLLMKQLVLCVLPTHLQPNEKQNILTNGLKPKC